MRKINIVESITEPNKDCLWLHNGVLEWFNPNGTWEKVNVDSIVNISSPTTKSSK